MQSVTRSFTSALWTVMTSPPPSIHTRTGYAPSDMGAVSSAAKANVSAPPATQPVNVRRTPWYSRFTVLPE